ncbi:alpha-2,8-sialyltransferase 8E-like [Mixophyes fleayi]|uniref:alpha-2,8-sialyltransferase 8E-like n=1 Tax=Mixophyes fleayi TaxID=3061075 RepID=UPI003F4DAD04
MEEAEDAGQEVEDMNPSPSDLGELAKFKEYVLATYFACANAYADTCLDKLVEKKMHEVEEYHMAEGAQVSGRDSLCSCYQNLMETNATNQMNTIEMSKLKKCCNASYAMIVTQENSPVGHVFRYDGQRRKQIVTESLYKLFPMSSPFQKPIRSCAVVGNAGILKNSFCGAEIDQADFVFRMNLPPVNVTDDIGSKTDLVSVNPSILTDKFGHLREKRKPFINMMRAYGSALVLLPAFSLLMSTDVSLRAIYTIKDFDVSSRVVFINPQYMGSLTLYWKNMKLKFNRISSGLLMVSAALEICEKVTLYDFWPFSQGLNGYLIPRQYYKKVPPKGGFNPMADEFYRYVQMHSQGALQLNLGAC